MKKNFIFLLIFCLSIISCKKGNIQAITDLFIRSEVLVHKNLNIKDDLDILLSPGRMSTYNNFLIAHDSRSSLMFSLIDLETNIINKSWGMKGQGSGEIVAILDFYKNYNDTGINAWDPMLQRLNFYSFEDILKNTIITPLDLFKDTKGVTGQSFREQFYPNILQINESFFLALGNMDGKRFTLIDIISSNKTGIGEFPQQDDNDIIPILKNQAYNGCIRYNKRQNKVAYISYNSEMFEIFDVNDSNLNLKYGNYTTIPKFTFQSGGQSPGISIEKFSNGNGCNVALSVSDDKIFILYQQFEKEIDDSDIGKYTSRDANKVLVFTWDGKPIKMYELDCMVEEIEYNENRNQLFAVKSEPEPEIVCFDLDI